MRLSQPTPGGAWQWDTKLPPLPADGARITAAAHSIDDRWLVIGMGASGLVMGARPLPGYKLDLRRAAAGTAAWERIAPYTLDVATPQQAAVATPQQVHVALTRIALSPCRPRAAPFRCPIPPRAPE